MAYNPPPDDFVLDVSNWLKNEIYPGLLNEPFDFVNDPQAPDKYSRALSVWVSGHRGYIAVWQTNGLDDNPTAKHQNAKEVVYKRIYETKYPPAPPDSSGGITGFLRVDRLGFADDGGPRLPLLCHFGEAFSAYVRRPQEVRDELGRIKNAGYLGIRFWDVLGYWDAAWAGREVTPFPFTNHSGKGVRGTPGYYDQLASFLRDLQSLGLKAHHSRGDLNSWNTQMIEAHLKDVARVQREVGLDVICLNEVCNESWQNGIPDPNELKRLAGLLPAETIRATSAADDGYGGELPDSFDRYALDTQIIHGYRGGESHNRIAHIFAVGYETCPAKGKTAWQSEPSGPGSGVTVGQENHPEALCLMAASALSSHQAWNYMSSNGVFWNGSISVMPGFQEVARIASIIPVDIQNGWDLFHGGERWRDKRVLEASLDGTLRCDHMVKGSQFQVICYGLPKTWQIPVRRSFEGVVIKPATLERMAVSKRAGDILEVNFERGCIVQGRLL